MRRDPFEGLHDVAPAHAEVDALLLAWAKWSRGGRRGGPSTAPGFALRSGAGQTRSQGMSDADAMRVGRAVAALVPIRGAAMRWYYLGNEPPSVFCRRHNLEPWWLLPRMVAYARGELAAALGAISACTR